MVSEARHSKRGGRGAERARWPVPVGCLSPSARRGVSLTEVLIAMLVMAIGLLGLFALFPLGLLNVTRAVTHNRSETLAQSAEADLQTYNLLAPERYYFGTAINGGPFTPFVYDTYSLSSSNPPPPVTLKTFPVAIDPVWIRTNVSGNPIVPPFPRLGFLDLDGDGFPDSQLGLGLQRVIPTDGLDSAGDADALVDASDNDGDGVADTWPDLVPSGPIEPYLSPAQTQAIFAGRDDLVFREDDASLPLPLVDPTTGQTVGLQSERNYTWLAIARLADVSDPRTYEVSIATFYKRDLGAVDPLTNTLVGGEQVLRAVYLPDLANDPTGKTPSNRVILRWPATAAEPDLRREGWILDATYSLPFSAGPHRGYWYHYVQVSEPRVAVALGEVHVTLTLDAPAREVTFPLATNPTENNLLNGIDDNGNGLVDLEDFDPTNTAVNVAVIIPGVVSVYERTMHAQ